MTIVEALKNFYKGNAYNEQELKEADNVLDAIRAKYGPYEGANIAEYLQTAMANGVTPGSGGGGGDLSTAEVTVTLANQCGLYVPCVISGEYNTATFIIRESGTYQVILYKGEAFGLGIHRDGDEVVITVTGNAEAEDEEVYITGNCTLSVSTV